MSTSVETRVLIQAVKRNEDRFPTDFMFELTQNEFDSLRSQFVTSKALFEKNGRKLFEVPNWHLK